jgi:serine/threonine protein kinase
MSIQNLIGREWIEKLMHAIPLHPHPTVEIMERYQLSWEELEHIVSRSVRNRIREWLFHLPTYNPMASRWIFMKREWVQGGYGTIYKLHQHNRKYIYKELKVETLDSFESLLREVYMYTQFPLFTAPCVYVSHQGIICERAWCAGHTLLELTPPQLFPISRMIRDLYQQLYELHHLGISHGDIKLDNVLIFRRERHQYTYLWNDWGSTSFPKWFPQKIRQRTTAIYWPYEVWAYPDTVISPAGDKWAFGCLVYELLFGTHYCPPRIDVKSGYKFAHPSDLEVAWLRLQCQLIPTPWRDFLIGCLHPDPAQRWSYNKGLHYLQTQPWSTWSTHRMLPIKERRAQFYKSYTIM